MFFSEEELYEAANDPDCPYTYEELWELFCSPRGRPILEVIEELEKEDLSEQ